MVLLIVPDATVIESLCFWLYRSITWVNATITSINACAITVHTLTSILHDKF